MGWLPSVWLRSLSKASGAFHKAQLVVIPDWLQWPG
jgi:hypothetical protein